jgi:hypothetical protein
MGGVLAAAAHAQVTVQPLAAPDLFSIPAAPTDLPADLWQGSSGALVKLVIPTLGQKPLTPPAQSLARRVLSTGANGPEGVGDDPALAGARANALLQLGDAAGAQSIADHTPNLAQNPDLSRAAAEASLIAGDEDKACGLGDALVNGRTDPFWLRLRAYCQAKAGQTAAAQLTLDLASQQDPSPDYQRLMAAMVSAADPGAPALDDGVDYAVSRHVLTTKWTDGLDKAAPPIAVAVAHDAMAPPDARLAAQARALRLGFPAPDAYALVSPIPPDAGAADQPGPAGEAALMALANTSPDFGIKEASILALLKRAHDVGEFESLAKLAAPAIAQLMAAKPVLSDATTIAMAAAAAGDVATASAARDEIRPEASTDAISTIAMLNALIAAAGGSKDGAVVDALDHVPPGGARACTAIGLLGALGYPVGPQARLDLSACDIGPTRAGTARLAALDLAARSGAKGDVALYVLQTSADAGAALTYADRAALIRALETVGLHADARAFAVEGLLALQRP